MVSSWNWNSLRFQGGGIPYTCAAGATRIAQSVQLLHLFLERKAGKPSPRLYVAFQMWKQDSIPQSSDFIEFLKNRKSTRRYLGASSEQPVLRKEGNSDCGQAVEAGGRQCNY